MKELRFEPEMLEEWADKEEYIGYTPEIFLLSQYVQ